MKFELFRIIIFRSYCHFSVGGGGKRLPYRSRVKIRKLRSAERGVSQQIYFLRSEIQSNVHKLILFTEQLIFGLDKNRLGKNQDYVF